MSRLGKLPIELPAGTTATFVGGVLTVKGPKGQLAQAILDTVKVTMIETSIQISVPHPEVKKEKALWGLFYSLVKNMVIGVNQGYEKKLELSGVGYKVSGGGAALTLNLGFSHPIQFKLPDGVTSALEGNTIIVSGIDKQLVGETAARIRRLKKPEPYKGKGIRYSDEIVRRKAGKTATKGA